MKRKRIASISTAHIEHLGELEDKKSLFEDILVFFSKLRRSGKNPATFVSATYDFQVLLSVQ